MYLNADDSVSYGSAGIVYHFETGDLHDAAGKRERLFEDAEDLPASHANGDDSVDEGESID